MFSDLLGQLLALGFVLGFVGVVIDMFSDSPNEVSKVLMGAGAVILSACVILGFAFMIGNSLA